MTKAEEIGYKGQVEESAIGRSTIYYNGREVDAFRLNAFVDLEMGVKRDSNLAGCTSLGIVSVRV